MTSWYKHAEQEGKDGGGDQGPGRSRHTFLHACSLIRAEHNTKLVASQQGFFRYG